jgi:hypothetical protein
MCWYVWETIVQILLNELAQVKETARNVLWSALLYVEFNYNLNEFNGAIEAIRTLEHLYLEGDSHDYNSPADAVDWDADVADSTGLNGKGN